jgi:hypothetical protein
MSAAGKRRCGGVRGSEEEREEGRVSSEIYRWSAEIWGWHAPCVHGISALVKRSDARPNCLLSRMKMAQTPCGHAAAAREGA